MNHGLQILNQSRQMVIKCWTKRKSKEWIQYLKAVANQSARDFTSPNVHHSFAPPRPNTAVATLVDGRAYMSAVADAMELAREEIFIADWWLSPEIYMKRPALSGDYWRLDSVLKRKAVFRHPDHAKAGVFFWAHHEKIVVVDQCVAFTGGIDLCYGRWDDHKHRLTDLGNISQPKSSIKMKMKTSSSPGGGLYLPNSNGLDAAIELAKSTKDMVIGYNDVLPDENKEEESSEQLTDQVNTDTSIQTNIPVLEPGDNLLINTPKPNLTEDLSVFETPEVQKRNVLNKITDRGKDIISIIYPPYEDERNEQKFDDSERKKAQKYAMTTDQVLLTDTMGMNVNNANRSVSQPPPLAQVVEGRVVTEHTGKGLDGIEGNSKLWIGKDYTNFIVKDFTNLDLPFVDLVDRNTTPRMPWHDVGIVVQGAAARDVARHFIQRWNAIKLEKARVSSWSCGFLDPDTVEQSIHQAYVDTITRAQHYVYIENQFFITLSRSNTNVRNQIGEALFNRIMRAHRAKAKFRVFVVMPLLPGFEGEVGAPSGTSLHAVTHWNYQSISRSREAILTRLYEAGVAEPRRYISFHGLRTHAALGGEPVTELVYVHSKLLLCDDRALLCGSANANDRSMLGGRDSELAALLQVSPPRHRAGVRALQAAALRRPRAALRQRQRQRPLHAGRPRLRAGRAAAGQPPRHRAGVRALQAAALRRPRAALRQRQRQRPLHAGRPRLRAGRAAAGQPPRHRAGVRALQAAALRRPRAALRQRQRQRPLHAGRPRLRAGRAAA
ncbi:hypothetical protein ACJJTC_012792, partial [Scirpophaga incertulas]